MFEAVRELLFNVVKHAETGRARVAMARSPPTAVCSWWSPTKGPASTWRNSRPTSTTATGFGLFSIRERLELMGGRLEVETAPGRGTRVTICAVPPAGRSEADPAAISRLVAQRE